MNSQTAKKQVGFASDDNGGVIKPVHGQPLTLFEVVDPITSDDSAILVGETWQDIEFEVALGSGSQDHVCDEQDCPGYSTPASPGSSHGQCFSVGDGGKLENKGQRHLTCNPSAIPLLP